MSEYSRKFRKMAVDGVWLDNLESIGHNGYDVAIYISDGVSLWPCGETVDAKENTGVDYCECNTCSRVRKSLEKWPLRYH